MNLHQLYLKQVEAWKEKGIYSFRFEYDDKDGKRRFEVGYWNDGMPAKDALYRVAQHVSEYENGEITDFIENKYFLSSRHKDTIELIEAMGKMLDTIDQDDHGHEENVIRARVKSDLLIRLEEQLKLIKKEQ